MLGYASNNHGITLLCDWLIYVLRVVLVLKSFYINTFPL